ncbi:MAG: Holliday junction branch migration protein RuvA [Cellvibrionales bacterium]|nr:Holliday junction branch migration protein RuvA [Cellvibrionales bacterium]
MIGWLKGELKMKQPPLLMVDVGGVGYEVLAPMTTFYSLPESGTVEIFTHFVVREDAQQLYGFSDTNDRALFRQLIKINGVGPKLALAILSSIDTDAFVESVESSDVNRLVKIPGIGKKTAERLLIEMKDKLKDLGFTIKPQQSVNDITASSSITAEAESALVALGYKLQDAIKMIQSVKDESITTAESLIRAALKQAT